MHTVEIVLLVLMLGAVSGLASRYLPIVPLPLLQIALGAVLSWPQAGLHVAFDPELFLLLFIPPLLFADGWRMPKREFFALRKPILTLAFGLVFFTVLGLGYFMHWMIPELPLTVCFALAAVLSPTDAVAVSAITKRLGMPEKTMHILEGESMLNDASGLVALKFAVVATLTGAFSLAEASRSFLYIAIGGLAVGVAAGWAFATARKALTHRTEDGAASQAVLLLLLLPFAVYLLGEHLGVSGILAAVAAGITTNFADLERSEFIAERMQTQNAWAMVESAFNGAIFLLLGLQLPSIMGQSWATGSHPWWEMLGFVCAITTVLLAMRALWLMLSVRRAVGHAQRKGKTIETPSLRLIAAATLAGIRGAVTLAGALSIPLLMGDGSPFPGREMVIFLATGVILFTLIAASIGLPLLLASLKLPPEPPHAREERLARSASLEAALATISKPSADAAKHSTEWHILRSEALERITRDYRARLELLDEAAPPSASDAEEEQNASHAKASRSARYVMELEFRLQALHAERQSLYQQRRAHKINDESLRSMVQEVDLSEISLSRRLMTAKQNARADAALAAASMVPPNTSKD